MVGSNTIEIAELHPGKLTVKADKHRYGEENGDYLCIGDSIGQKVHGQGDHQ